MAEDSDQINWHVDMEVNLFHAMRGHKPVGVNRFFQMVFIHDKLNSSLQKNVSSEQIWKQLKKMYDLQALNESEIIPFPNKDVDFTLPDVEFGDLMDKEFPRMPKTGPSQAAVGSKQGTDSLISTPKAKGAQSGSSVPSGSNTPDISPKRKRTRNTQSTPTSANSTPDAPPTKRRR